MPDDTTRRVLNTLLANTNDAQGEWVRKRTVFVTCVAHANLDADAVDQALHHLVRDGKIEAADDRYRVREGVERIPHPGEVQT